MSHLLYLMFRCDFDVMESLENWEEFGVSKHTVGQVVESVVVVRSAWSEARGASSTWREEFQDDDLERKAN